MASRFLRAVFPMGGLVRAYGFQSQPPYSSPDMLNVWPKHAGDTVLTAQRSRVRGGRRPGIKASHSGGPFPVGAAAAVRLLSTLNPVRNEDLLTELDGFIGDELESHWSAASWIAGGKPGIWPDDPDDVTFENPRGAVRDAIEDMNVLRPYTLELQCVAQDGSFQGKYSIPLLMDDTTPNVEQDGVLIELEMTDASGTFTGKVYRYEGGVQVSGSPWTFDDLSESPIGDVDDGALEVLVIPTLDDPAAASPSIVAVELQVFWKDNLVHVARFEYTPPGSRFGFTLEATNSVGVALSDWFNVTYRSLNSQVVKNDLTLLMSAGGKLFRESADLITFNEVVSECNLADDRSLQAVEWGGKLYIADYGDIKAQGAGLINLNGDELRNSEGYSWLDRGIDKHNDVVVLTNGQGAIVNGTVRILEVSDESIKLSRNVNMNTSTNGGGTCDVRIERAPKVYDPNTGKLEIWETALYESGETPYVANRNTPKGEVPTGCRTIALFRDRIAMAGASHNPRLWFMLRQGDPEDADYSVTDAGAAVAGTVNTQAGIPGDGITALVTHTDDYLLMGTRRSLWKMEGDPTDGGQLVVLSYTKGIVSGKAWAYGPAGEVFFFSYGGLQVVPPGADGYPREVGTEDDGVPDIPDEFTIEDVDRDEYEFFLEYDINLRGLFISMVHSAGASALPVSSVTYASGKATVTCSTFHLLRTGRRIVGSGWTQTAYNVNKAITVTGSTTFTYPVSGAPASPATGGGTIKAAGVHFWWDERTKRFFPITFPLGWEPSAVLAVNSRFGTDSAVYFGNRDGYVGAFRAAFETDGTGENFESYVFLGPFGLEGGTVASILTEISAILGEDSHSVTWSLHAGDTAEEALSAAAFDSGTFTEGANYLARPRMRSRAFYVKLTGPADNPWSMEEVQLGLMEAGRFRKL